MEESSKGILDLSKKCLKKVPKQEDAQNVRVLILDDNELQKIDNIDSYLRIEKLSLCKNQLLRMYGVCRLHCLKELNLSYNGILTIEGLKELVHLVHLNLEGNNIKTIEHLNTNTKLEYLNLSENSIGSLSDISFLKNLKDLFLNGNRLSHLRQCDKYLPTSLETLSLAKNNISDLNEICTLGFLCNLHSISITENPCVQMNGSSAVGFDYRPFVLNWCMSVKLIDGFVVNPIESLKAEWLYSQGRGRQFRIGEQQALARYLASVCPLSGETLENENERKLRLILSKAQQHQRQLQEEISCTETTYTSGSNSPSSARRKGVSSRIQSPRFQSRLGVRQGSPDSLSNSYHGNTSCSIISNQSDSLTATNQLLQMTTSLIENIKSDNLMTQSLDPQVLSNNVKNASNSSSSPDGSSRNQNLHLSPYNGQQSHVPAGGPLAAASKMMPVPESLMSPDCCPSPIVQKVITQTHTATNSSANSKYVKAKETKAASPKINRSPHMKRNEKSPVLSPRKNVTSGLCRGNLQDNFNKQKGSFTQHTSPDMSAAVSSDDDSDHINIDKLKTIRNKAAQRAQQQQQRDQQFNAASNKITESSVILIQKIWRGYNTRKMTKHVADILQKKRTQEYIKKLTDDMELTKVALENERKIQQLQMQAINALWKKVSAMQESNPPNDSTNSNGTNFDNVAIVHDLAKTCSMLTNQVQQLQGSMRDILNCMTVFCNLPQNSKSVLTATDESKDCSGTQTEIIAVHTPQVENLPFPFNNKLTRPSTLPLESAEALSKGCQAIEACEEVIPSHINDKSQMSCKDFVQAQTDVASIVELVPPKQLSNENNASVILTKDN